MRRAKRLDVAKVHCARLQRRLGSQSRQIARTDYGQSRREIASAHAAMSKLNCSEAAVRLDGVDLGGMAGNVIFVPNALHRVIGHIGIRRDLRYLHRDRTHPPSAFMARKAMAPFGWFQPCPVAWGTA